MGTRGPKSADELTTLQGLAVIERPEPPYTLWRDQEQEVWRRVVSDVPADWFTGRHLDLLAEYCSHVVSARRLAQVIHQMEHGPDPLDLPTWAAMMRAHAQQTTRVQSLATAMRLTHQASYGARRAATALEGEAKGRRPWEV